jgi:II/X family phage/plasmid replication protein
MTLQLVAAQPVRELAIAPAVRPEGRDVLVTRPVSATDGTEQRESTRFFVDWLSISQVHTEGGLPEVDAGCVMGINEGGELEWKTTRAVKHEGSFETSLNVRCDGHRVTFSGNVSRFGRPDNLFGFDFWECLDRVNAVLAHYSLPPFTAGKKIERIGKGEVRIEWTGARVSRIDLTANYEAGSADDAHAVMQFLGSQHARRHEGRVLGQGETVAWGVGSRRQYWKAYIKHLELLRHGGGDERVIEHCASRGVVRFEGTLRSNALTDLGCAFLGDYESGWAMGQLVKLFDQQTEIMHRAQHSTDDLDELPRHLRATARDYMAGMDCSSVLSRRTFYRHRADLLPYGIDIAVRNVRPFQPRVRVIELRPAEVPSWYQLAA